jgi:hypothetical protein
MASRLEIQVLEPSKIKITEIFLLHKIVSLKAEQKYYENWFNKMRQDKEKGIDYRGKK